jgi:phospholipid/cholesterol/gamma-HCH transport system permease protein
MSTALATLGRSTLALAADSGAMVRLLGGAAQGLFVAPWRGRRVSLRATVAQLARAGSDALPLVALLNFLVGMIIALQSAYQLDQFGATTLIPALVAISVTRELAPLLTAIIITGRFGSSITAELGTMSVSQEIDALTVMGIEPIEFLVVPRLAALAVALPCLVVFADAIGILGGMAVGLGVIGMGWQAYLDATLDALVLEDVATGLIKSLAFALVIGLVGCHQGLATRGGAEEVGRATTASVVRSIVLIIAADLLVTAFFYLGE